MALRQLILAHRIEQARDALAAARARVEELSQARAALEAEEAQIAEALGEVTEETSAEDRETIERTAQDFDTRAQAHRQEETQAGERVRELEGQLTALENEQAEMTRQAEETARQAAQQAGAGSAGQEGREAGAHENNRTEGRTMNTRAFFGMDMQARDAFFAREDMREFMTRVRGLRAQSRDVKGGELLIPQVALPILRQVAGEASKLLRHVNHVTIGGTGRQTIAGSIPEAIWTEMRGAINELSISFNMVETDGYKVAGYIAVANSTLEDSDIDLAAEVFEKLGRAIGKALDMAILYGTGKKMPLGIITRLAQTAQPDTYSDKARPWENLSASNVVAISGKTGAALFKEIIKAVGKAKNKYATGGLFWAMNSQTHMNLIAETVGFNAAGAVVAGMNDTMPVIGGMIEELDFIPDDVIVCGYEGLYLLAERAGTTLAMSEHLRFLEDETVFKGVARYDGLPVIAEGFVAIGIGGVKPAANAVTFAEDKANAAE